MTQKKQHSQTTQTAGSFASYWYKLEDVNQELFKLRQEGIKRGNEIGWDFDKIGMSIKKGCTTYLAAPPATGKSEFWLEILINLSCLYGWKHIVFTPETGNVQEIFAELCYKYIRKPYFSTVEGCMSEAEKTIAEQFIAKHFIVIDPKDNTLTVNDFYKIADEVEKELGIIFDTTTIDPFNELEWDGQGLSRDLVIEKQLGDCRRNARKTGRHNCLITHVRDQPMKETEGVTYYPMPTARDFSGGQAWFRKGEQMVIMWRPPTGVTRETGEGIYQGNEVIIKVAKEKPKGSSRKGSYTFFYDVHRNAYYYLDGERRVYAKRDLKVEQTVIKEEKPNEQAFFKNESLKRTSIEDHLKNNEDFYNKELPW